MVGRTGDVSPVSPAVATPLIPANEDMFSSLFACLSAVAQKLPNVFA